MGFSLFGSSGSSSSSTTNDNDQSSVADNSFVEGNQSVASASTGGQLLEQGAVYIDAEGNTAEIDVEITDREAVQNALGTVAQIATTSSQNLNKQLEAIKDLGKTTAAGAADIVAENSQRLVIGFGLATLAIFGISLFTGRNKSKGGK